MDERCRRTHANLLAGTCPWCGQPIIKGQLPVPTMASASTGAVLPPSAISLKDLVTRAGPLDVKTVAQHIEEVARQLEEFHSSAVLRLHVSPNCIFVDETGIARLVVMPIFPPVVPDESSFFSSFFTEMERAGLGIVDYLAPEAALQSHLIDARSDIYSLGCTMYFLLTGRPPFSEGSISERLLKHQTATPDKIQGLRPDVPLALISICETMMAKKPSERFQTAKEVGDALAAWRAENGA
jgi:eukaryotic-like serine/threonine-protein kinase